MAERRYGEAPPKTDTTLGGADWYGRQIERERHENTLFVDLDLTEAQTIGAVFHECTFRRARFNAWSHQASAFVNCTLRLLQVLRQPLYGVQVRRQHVQCLRIRPDAGFGRRLVLYRPAGRGARPRLLQGHRLGEADLTGAWLHGADFIVCDLRGSDLSAIEPENVRLKEAIITTDQTIIIAEALGLDVRRK
ncbi:pentapeptide repeat-containing protein [Ensifer sp. IC3342]|nr:pentapeptide repeat-containing protein [Ensifer sp. BRP08]MCA1450158.1 pentapeptide repeat-containing protein [Ensifer sp. IC3342]